MIASAVLTAVVSASLASPCSSRCLSFDVSLAGGIVSHPSSSGAGRANETTLGGSLGIEWRGYSVLSPRVEARVMSTIFGESSGGETVSVDSRGSRFGVAGGASWSLVDEVNYSFGLEGLVGSELMITTVDARVRSYELSDSEALPAFTLDGGVFGTLGPVRFGIRSFASLSRSTQLGLVGNVGLLF